MTRLRPSAATHRMSDSFHRPAESQPLADWFDQVSSLRKTKYILPSYSFFVASLVPLGALIALARYPQYMFEASGLIVLYVIALVIAMRLRARFRTPSASKHAIWDATLLFPIGQDRLFAFGNWAVRRDLWYCGLTAEQLCRVSMQDGLKHHRISLHLMQMKLWCTVGAVCAFLLSFGWIPGWKASALLATMGVTLPWQWQLLLRHLPYAKDRFVKVTRQNLAERLLDLTPRQRNWLRIKRSRAFVLLFIGLEVTIIYVMVAPRLTSAALDWLAAAAVLSACGWLWWRTLCLQLLYRRLWFHHARQTLREMQRLNGPFDLFLRRFVENDPDWAMGQEAVLEELRAELRVARKPASPSPEKRTATP